MQLIFLHGPVASGKLTSLDLLRRLRPEFDAAAAAMPAPLLTVDTGAVTAREAAEAIAGML